MFERVLQIRILDQQDSFKHWFYWFYLFFLRFYWFYLFFIGFPLGFIGFIAKIDRKPLVLLVSVLKSIENHCIYWFSCHKNQ